MAAPAFSETLRTVALSVSPLYRQTLQLPVRHIVEENIVVMAIAAELLLLNVRQARSTAGVIELLLRTFPIFLPSLRHF